MSRVVSCYGFFPKCIFSFIFSADGEQMIIAFPALCIGDLCIARWDLLLQVIADFF